MIWLDSITNSMGMNLSKLQEIVKGSEASCAAVQRVRHHLATEQQQNTFEELCWWLSGKCRRNRFDSLVGRSPGKGNGNPLQYSCLGNLMERGVWCAAVHRVTKELNTTQQLNNNRFESVLPKVTHNIVALFLQHFQVLFFSLGDICHH